MAPTTNTTAEIGIESESESSIAADNQRLYCPHCGTRNVHANAFGPWIRIHCDDDECGVMSQCNQGEIRLDVLPGSL